MRFKKIIQLFEDGNVCVTGLRGRGKDMLFANVIIRRKIPYISNIDYGGAFNPLNFKDIDCGHNTFKNFVSGDVNKYCFPYPDGTDVYLSDAGIYFPAQYCNELNKLYPDLAVYQCISRHVSNGNFHCNAQSLNRVWDKIREQSDIYIMCRKCIYFRGFVLMFITTYDKYQSCVDRLRPLRLPLAFNSQAAMMRKIQLQTYEASHGRIEDHVLFFRNLSNYNTRQFQEILEKGK